MSKRGDNIKIINLEYLYENHLLIGAQKLWDSIPPLPGKIKKIKSTLSSKPNPWWEAMKKAQDNET